MESPEFPYQASSQPCVWHVLAGAVAESEMALPQFPHSPAGARAWFNPAQPQSQLLSVLAEAYPSLAHFSPHVNWWVL